MKKIAIVTPYPLGTAPSQRFRHEHYLSDFKEFGFEYDYLSFMDEKLWATLYNDSSIRSKVWGVMKGYSKRILQCFSINKFDYVYIHREAAPFGPAIFEYIYSKILKKPIIIDYDDAIWKSGHIAANKRVQILKNRGKLRNILKWSYKASCGNAYLADFAKQHGANAFIIPTVVDTEHIHNPALYQKMQSEVPVVGWTGSHSTLIYLNEIVPVVRELQKTKAFKFMVIADKDPQFPDIDYIFRKWNKETEIEDLMKIDIGVMPLVDNEWTKGKCGFKAIQYMALGIPAIVSKVGVNTKIVDQGNSGYHVENDHDWLKYLTILLEDKKLRTDMGQEARKTIVDNYSVQSQKGNFFKLFS